MYFEEYLYHVEKLGTTRARALGQQNYIVSNFPFLIVKIAFLSNIKKTIEKVLYYTNNKLISKLRIYIST